MSEQTVAIFRRKSGGFEWTQSAFQEFPSFNLVKELEQKHAKRDLIHVHSLLDIFDHLKQKV